MVCDTVIGSNKCASKSLATSPNAAGNSLSMAASKIMALLELSAKALTITIDSTTAVKVVSTTLRRIVKFNIDKSLPLKVKNELKWG